MCGICGTAAADSTSDVSVATLERMQAALAHRGPDGNGMHVAAGVGLVHTRLSIIDVDGGQQPLANEDGSVWITFNGEIYNYRELRDLLLARGHRFRTGSDTEVLVHLYEDEGPALVHRLNGMFAFAIHDLRQQRVVLARDPFGIKPLFYAVHDHTLYFGSEIKAVLAGLPTARETTPAALQEYLLFRGIGDDRSFFRHVRRLPPGTVATWSHGTLTTRPYWEAPTPAHSRAPDRDEAVDELAERLERAVASQMMSEVPLGTYCSGGVDSGLTSWYAAHHAEHPLHTFSVGFRDAAWDESALARDTATRIGSSHHVLEADPSCFLEALPRMLWHHDEPIGHPNSILIALLSRFARERVTVVLTGEGSDELFGGYPRHHLVPLGQRLRGWPRPVRHLARTTLQRAGGRKGRLIADAATRSDAESIALNSAVLGVALVEALTGRAPHEVIAQRATAAEQLMVPGDPMASMQRHDQRYYLPALLDRMDRMTMASGLEGRVPFLDLPLATWAGTIPTRLKTQRFGNKRLVKALAARHLSPQVVHGPKSGFGVPFGAWLRSPAWRPLVDRLLDPRHAATSMLDASVVHRLVHEHLHGGHDHGEALWLLTNLYLWFDTRLDP